MNSCSQDVVVGVHLDQHRYVLRNLGTQYLIIAGCLTDQCVDSAVRDACDLGYLVTVRRRLRSPCRPSGTIGRCAITAGTAASARADCSTRLARLS